MAFDVNNPTDVAALKTELTTDPVSIGYNLNGAVSRIVFLINDPDSNSGATPIEREFDAAALMDALVPSDFASQQTATDAAVYCHTLVELAAYGDISPYKTKFRDLFAANSATVAALDSQTRVPSRAEVLFGNNVVLSENDINVALSS